MRSAMRGVSRLEDRRLDEGTLAELHIADAKMDVWKAGQSSCTYDCRIKVRIMAR